MSCSRRCRFALCAGFVLAFSADIAHGQRVRFEGAADPAATAGGSSSGSSLPDGATWVARGSGSSASSFSSAANSASSATPASASVPASTTSTPPAYTTYTAGTPIYTTGTPIYTAALPSTTTVAPSIPAPAATLPSPAAAYGESLGPPPLLSSSSAWDPYRVAQRPAMFSGTITSASGQYMLPQPMPRVPYYTQQPVATTSQPYVVVPEAAPTAIPGATPGAVIMPGPTPPPMISSPAVPTLGPPLAPVPAPVFSTSCYAIADAIFFTRNVQAGNQALILTSNVPNVTDPNVLASTADLGFQFEVGPRITLGHEFDNSYAFEATYFGIFNFHDSLTRTGMGDLNLPGDLALTGGLAFIGADQITVTYDSVVNNGELNLLRGYGNISCLIGFRYFELGERFSITAIDAVDGTGFYNLNAYNNLFGLQGGARIQQSCGNWSYDLTGKAGVYGNEISSSQVVVDVDPSSPLRAVHNSGAQVAFIGELGFNGNYQFSPNWFLRGGYQVFWVDGVALAPNQLDFTDTTDSGTRLNKTGSLFMQGANAGLMARW